MDNVNQLINSALKQGTSGHSTSTQTFNHSKPVNYFFAWLKMTYPQDYSFNVAPTDRREDMIKASSSQYLDGCTKDQINKGIEFIREMKQNGESRYLKLDVDLCIGAIRDANRSTASHKALPAPEGERMDKDDAMARLAAIRAESCPEPAEPRHIDTTAVESELEAIPVIERGGE